MKHLRVEDTYSGINLSAFNLNCMSYNCIFLLVLGSIIIGYYHVLNLKCLNCISFHHFYSIFILKLRKTKGTPTQKEDVHYDTKA